MSDLIRRQDVLKICDKYNGQGWVWSMIRKEVEELPCDGCCTAHSGYEAGMNREETIRRQDVLDLAKRGVLISNGNYESVCKAINEIPPADEDEWVKRSDILRVIDKRVDERLSESKWIPVSERLPEESLNSVIGWDAYRERCVFVQYIDGYFQITGSAESFDIVAWMPLPKPYRSQERSDKE